MTANKNASGMKKLTEAGKLGGNILNLDGPRGNKIRSQLLVTENPTIENNKLNLEQIIYNINNEEIAPILTT